MTYQPPKHVLDVLQSIEFEDALELDDPRYVDTREARGSQRTLDRLARKFGLLLADGRFAPTTQKHVLFFGHTGSGKTTELRRYAKRLSGPGSFYVVEVGIPSEVDRHNLKYADALMAMARVLFARLQAESVLLPSGALGELEQWFAERVLSEDELKEFAATVDAGAKAKGGIPYLLDLFARFTVSYKSNVTYKETLRRVVRNNFNQFTEAFNRFLRTTEAALDRQGRGKRVLFVLDGTDKLRGEDTRSFFVEDAEQLLAIDAHVVYTAPLSLKYEGHLAGKLDADLVLPMIKLDERDGGACAAGRRAMRDILLRRADRALFATEAEIDRLVEHSGGHPRELLRLLKRCCEEAPDNLIEASTVEIAVRGLAADYRHFLEPEDYLLLAKIDHDPAHGGNDERTRRLLYTLALMEYNDGSWRRSHPVVRLLEGYQLTTSRLAVASADD